MRAACDDLRTRRQQRGAPVALRVRVRDRAADRAEVADDRIGDLRRRLAQDRIAVAQELRALARLVPHERADPECASVLGERVEAGDPVDVDEHLRRGEAQLQERDEALPARQHLRLVAALGEDCERLVERFCCHVVERCRVHAASCAASISTYDARMKLDSVAEVEAALRADSYLPDRGLATAIYLALAMRRPLLLEGEPGVGKTEVGKTLARVLGAELVRLQCYEGIDASQALYEWDYSRQLLATRTESGGAVDLYGPEFLVERPLLRAIRSGAGAVLLVDELDRADDEFEAFLLEVLSDFSVTIPELGRVAAAEPPAVVVTSNRTRELHDALKRRCLYHWIEFPDLEREVEIIRVRAPEVSERLARSVAEAIARLRELDLVKPPGAAEAIDWAQALALLGFESVERDDGLETLGWAVKNREDLRVAEAALVPRGA